MFVRYNNTLQFWEYDSSGGVGAGPWVKLPVDASKLIGVIPGGSLPANVAYKDQANVFIINQNINSTAASLHLKDISQPVDSGLFRIINTNQNIYLQALNDAATTSSGFMNLSRTGNLNLTGTLTEHGRTTPVGEWVNFTPVLAATSGTVTLTATLNCRYTLIGKTLIVSFYLNFTLSATPIAVTIQFPSGFVSSVYAATRFVDQVSPQYGGAFQVTPGGNTFNLYMDTSGGIPWVTGSHSIGVIASVEIQ